MTKDVVMLHGANAGGWCFDNFAKVFAAKGFTCHAPDLIGHGKNKASALTALASVGIPDYRAEMEAFLKTFDTPPVMLGHSMGAVIAQQLAAQGMARALILISPAPRAGILPTTGGEKQLDQDLMGLGAFWKMVIPPDFALSCIYSLNKVPTSEQRAVFDKFGPEFGSRLLPAVLLDARCDRRDRCCHRKGQLPCALPFGRRRQGGFADDRAGHGCGVSKRAILGASGSRSHAAGRARRGRNRPAHCWLDPCLVHSAWGSGSSPPPSMSLSARSIGENERR